MVRSFNSHDQHTLEVSCGSVELLKELIIGHNKLSENKILVSSLTSLVDKGYMDFVNEHVFTHGYPLELLFEGSIVFVLVMEVENRDACKLINRWLQQGKVNVVENVRGIMLPKLLKEFLYQWMLVFSVPRSVRAYSNFSRMDYLLPAPNIYSSCMMPVGIIMGTQILVLVFQIIKMLLQVGYLRCKSSIHFSVFIFVKKWTSRRHVFCNAETHNPLAAILTRLPCWQLAAASRLLSMGNGTDTIWLVVELSGAPGYLSSCRVFDRGKVLKPKNGGMSTTIFFEKDLFTIQLWVPVMAPVLFFYHG
ncbi:hypothetical protein MKW98_027771 [Papaver atlanticum]|uniref:Uncharacterized protein n=1 Tax=Papaver atlanticum TaxID=357466 RepID=A0AAD4SY21_9MAGN|nr:hypothetical protein MKW98_027771 [Papaver atlanticum]